MIEDDDNEPTLEEQADAAQAVEAFGRLNEAAQHDPWIAFAMLAYHFPNTWGPPPEGVTLDDLAQLAAVSGDDLRRWLQQ